MQLQNNFGLTGQTDADYDFFLCGKRCRKRKVEKRNIRFERRTLKNDERRANTERTRMETMLMKNSMTPSQSSPPRQSSSEPTDQQQPANIPLNANTPQPQQAGMGNSMYIILGAVLVGGFVWTQMNGKNKLPVTQPIGS